MYQKPLLYRVIVSVTKPIISRVIAVKLILLLLVLFSFPAWAGTSRNDSLQKQFNNLKGADKVAFLTNNAGKELSGDASFLKSGIKGILADPSILKQKGSLDSLYKLLKVLSKYQSVELSRPLVLAGTEAALEQDDHERAFLFELAFSDLFYDLNQADSATVYLDKASEIVKENNLDSQEHLLMSRRARIAEMKGRKLEALELFLQAARVYQAKNMQTELAVIYDNIGILHMGFHNNAEAVKYLKMAEAINQKPGLENQRNITYINLGVAYKEYDSLAESVKWYKKSIALSRQLHDEFQLARVYFNLGNALQLSGQLDEAKTLYDSSLYYCNKLNIDYGVLLITINMGEWHLLRKEYAAALECLSTAEKKLKSYNLPTETEEVLRLFALVYEATGNYPAALKNYKAHILLKDSIEGAKTKRSILELQARYEQERSLKEIASLNLAIQAGKASTRLYIIIFIVIIVVLLAAGTYLFINRRISLYKARIALQENEKLRLEMEAKDKDLMSKAVYMGHLNEIVSGMETRLKELLPSSSEENAGQLRIIMQDLKTESKQGTWKEFDVRFEQVHQDFSARLLAAYPTLSPAEIRICSFLRLNMTSKDIALLTNRSIRTIENTRNSIRSKMKLSPESNLVSHLLAI